MKKLVSIACALALAASLTACGGSKNLTDTYIKVGASPSPHADILRQPHHQRFRKTAGGKRTGKKAGKRNADLNRGQKAGWLFYKL